jgi:hypothetical protein
MAATAFFDENRTITGVQQPKISNDLDSIRAYQWEVFFGFHTTPNAETFAAKQVNGIGMQIEDIEVNRVNDKVYYPGRVSMDECVITFDNVRSSDFSEQLYDVFQAVYNPLTGDFGDLADGVVKNTIWLKQLNADMTVKNEIALIGAYPKKWTPAEYNYSTNDFHTVEMTFRYDFINHSGGTFSG